jgi:hypothetical protein
MITEVDKIVEKKIEMVMIEEKIMENVKTTKGKVR